MYHCEELKNTADKVTKITRMPNAHGIYEAEVSINGVTKTAKSTFFPKTWTPEQVLSTIEEAYKKTMLLEKISQHFH